MTSTIWWIRRDLRLSDNLALAATLAAGDQVVPVFVINPRLVDSADASQKRLAFLFDGLRTLHADLRARGSRLIIRRGDPAEELRRLAGESSATGVYAEEDVTPFARRRDGAVAEHSNSKFGSDWPTW